MGTSQSSNGSPSGVPMVPPWAPDPVPPLPPPGDAPPNDGQQPGGDQALQPQIPHIPKGPPPVAPPRRFGGANLNLGRFASSGDRREMRRALGHYVRKGYGGAGFATRRMTGTAKTAGDLYGALSTLARGDAAPSSALDPALLAGRSAQEVMDAVVEAVRPVDGTLDSEASREAIKYALSELFTHFPDAILLALTEEQRNFVIERYVARDVYARVALDLGKTVLEKAPTPRDALARLKEVYDYVRETVSAAFKRLRDAGQQMRADRISQMSQAAVQETFRVFADYSE